jgi:hypothetical protein
MGASLAACASPSRADGVAVTDVDVAVLDLKRAERRLDAHLRRVDADIARDVARARARTRPPRASRARTCARSARARRCARD